MLSTYTNNLIDQQNHEIEENNVNIFIPDNSNSIIQTPSIIIRLNPDNADTVNKTLLNSIPENIKSKLIFQLSSGYHISLEWFPKEEFNHTSTNILIEKLDEIFKDFKTLEGIMVLPISGTNSIWAAIDQDSEIKLLAFRKSVTQILRDLSLTPKINPDRYQLLYLSLARYLQPLTPSEKIQLRNIKPLSVPVKLETIEYSLAEKFADPQKSNILKKWTLKKNYLFEHTISN